MPARKKASSYIVDGIIYASANDVAYHNELKANPYVKSFSLPSKADKQKRSRFGAFKCIINGITFDSTMEGRFYAYLLTKQHDKDSGLESFKTQVSFTLIPGFTNKFTGKRIRPVAYIADFVLHYSDGGTRVVDVKGKKTPEFRIKEKLFMQQNPNTEFICVQWDSSNSAWRMLDDIEKDKRARKRNARKTSKKVG